VQESCGSRRKPGRVSRQRHLRHHQRPQPHIYIPDSAPLLDVIQTDAAINPATPAGPSATAWRGSGINTAIYSQSGGYDGLGFAIPIDTAKPIIEPAHRHRARHPPLAGHQPVAPGPRYGQELQPSHRQRRHREQRIAGAPADEAGLEEGDIIIAMDGTTIESMDQLVLEIRKHGVGDTVGHYLLP